MWADAGRLLPVASDQSRPGRTRAEVVLTGCHAYVMHEDVIQWILGATRSRFSTSDSRFPTLAGPKGQGTTRAALASNGVEDEEDDDQDYDDWNIPWNILSPEQIKVFVDRNIRPSSAANTRTDPITI